MGIMLLFLAPAALTGCGPTPALEIDLGNPSAPPPFSMPLPRAPTGTDFDCDVDHRRRLQVRSRTRRAQARHDLHVALHGPVQHDVTVVGGPEGFSAPWSLTGVFTHRFTKPGTYRLFCSLHPAKMVQQITVR